MDPTRPADGPSDHDAAHDPAAQAASTTPATAAASALLQQLNSQAALLRLLAVLAEHGIADQLAHGPRTAAELAHANRLDAAALHRALRFVASCGFFSEDDTGRFDLTPLAAALRSDVPGSIRERLRLPWQDLLWRSYQHLPATLASGRNAFELAHGRPMFEYLAGHPEVNAIFDRSMARVSQLENPLVARAWTFGAGDVVVDVAGGQGGLLAAVLHQHPGVRGVLFDQPQVVAAPEALRDPRLAGRWQSLGGDFFAEVPTGGDVYLLKRILHDWDDPRALAILRRCRAALSPTARLLVVDAVIAPGNDPDPNKFLDINMLTLNQGRERTAAELRELCTAAGLAIERIAPLPAPATLSLLEVRRA